MLEWWGALSSAQQTLWCVGIFSTTLFVLQTLMTLAGHGGHHDMDAGGHDWHIAGHTHDGHDGQHHPDQHHAEHGSFWHYFTVRNAINFFMGFSWGTLALKDVGVWLFPASMGGIVAGVGLVALMGLIMSALMRLESKGGEVPLEAAIGEEGVVAIRIPSQEGGHGKIHITYAERFGELEAVTEGPELGRGTRVIVTSVRGSHVVVKPTQEILQRVPSKEA
jgi:membrane protein implicated in regulation of membrane protease activity